MTAHGAAIPTVEITSSTPGDRPAIRVNGQPGGTVWEHRGLWQRHHYLAVDDGHGQLTSLRPEFLVSGNTVRLGRGIRPTELPMMVRARTTGDLTARTMQFEYDSITADEVAKAIAVSSFFGTRSLQLANLPKVPFHGLLRLVGAILNS